MELVFKVLQMNDLESVMSFEDSIMSKLIPDEMERMIAHWSSKTRKEALEHYLNLGWSFAATNNQDQILGYFIAQPLLFFEGQTQNLWVEHVRAENEEIHFQLCEIAYKLGREKHLQRVYFPQDVETQTAIKNFNPISMDRPIIFVKTTKG